MTVDKIIVQKWQIALVVLLFPGVYVINAYMPWSEGLWIDTDKAYFVPFWSSIVTLHIISTLIVLIFLHKSGTSVADIGLDITRTKVLIIALGLVVLGLFSVGFRELIPYENTDDLGLQVGWPVDLRERLFWIPICLCEGFCEELTYRGFAIPALRSLNLKAWQAVLIASLSFSLMHGAADLLVFAISFTVGVVFSAIYLKLKNLLPVMILHAMTDLSFIVAV